MRRVKSRDTGAEMIVRRLLHQAGFRYRLHGKDLPGKPDIVFVGKRKAVFVHGCFWHQHLGCPRSNRPVSNTNYWTNKLDRNVERDTQTLAALKEMGWQTLTIWECELRASDQLLIKLQSFLK